MNADRFQPLTWLPKGHLLCADVPVGTLISCDAGVLWITQEGDTRDIVLERTDAHQVDRPGKLLVQALAAGTVRFSPPERPARATLPDGTQVTLRPISGADLPMHERFLKCLSSHTRYLRLMGNRQLRPGELQSLVHPAAGREVAFVATQEIDRVEEELGIARWARTGDNAAEFAIVVADAWQGRGLGSVLMQRLIDAADEAGIERLHGMTLTANRGMLKLARRFGLRISREPGDATVTLMEREQPATVDRAAPRNAARAPAQSLSNPTPRAGQVSPKKRRIYGLQGERQRRDDRQVIGASPRR